MAGPEATIERRVCADALTKLGVASVKWGQDGWPDRAFLIPGGKPFLIEFKAPGEKPDPRQAYRIQCLREWGYNVQVHDDYDRAFFAVRQALAAAQLSKEKR